MFQHIAGEQDRTARRVTRRQIGGAVTGVVAAQFAFGYLGAGAAVAAPSTERVSVSSLERQADGTSGAPAVSADGRFVAFGSIAPNLGANNGGQVLLRDRAAGTTRVVSVSTGGSVGNKASRNPSISADGRYIAFESFATNLVSGDTNGLADVFVHDRVAGTTQRVSVSSAGVQADAASFNPSISGNGTYIAFESRAKNLAGVETGTTNDVFIRHRTVAITSRISTAASGGFANGDSQRPSVNFNGTKIAFDSTASNLVNNDTAGAMDVFVRTLSGGMVRASVSSQGSQGDHFSKNASINADGTKVAFESRASNLVGGDRNGRDDVFVRDLSSARTNRYSVGTSNVDGNGSSREPSISADGRYVAYKSNSSNLVFVDRNGQTQDVFVADTAAAPGFQNSLASPGIGTAGANHLSESPALSGNGQVLAFASRASNLVSNDTNVATDVFARTLR